METSSATAQKNAKYFFETLNLKPQSHKQLKLILLPNLNIYNKGKNLF